MIIYTQGKLRGKSSKTHKGNKKYKYREPTDWEYMKKMESSEPIFIKK